MEKQPRAKTSLISKIAFVMLAFVFVINIVSFVAGHREPYVPDGTAVLPGTADEPEEVARQEDREAQEEEMQPEQEQAIHEEPEEEGDTGLPEEVDAAEEIKEVSVTDISGIDEELAETLDRIAESFNSVAVSLAVFDGGYEFLTYQYGYADLSARRLVDADTKFRIASLSKLTSSIIAMTLVDAGILDLDENISVYLGYEVKNPNFSDIAITSRMLMQHTSSIIDSGVYLVERFSYASGTTQRLLSLSSTYENWQPGSLYEYSDFGLIVLGAICESVSGMLFDDLARDVLFAPLGIDAAYVPRNLQDAGNIAAIYDRNHTLTRSVAAQLGQGASGEAGYQHNTAQGSLTISALDYARILAMLAGGGTLGGVRILSEGAVREIHTADVQGAHYQQGLTVRFEENALLGDGVYWHTGSAYGTFAQFTYCIKTGRGVVVVTTGARTERRPNGMVILCTELTEMVWKPEN